MNLATLDPKGWIHRHQPDPRFPTNPEYVMANALSERYGVPEAVMKEWCTTHAGSCFRHNGNPWIDHGKLDQTLYFHEPTLQTKLRTGQQQNN